MNPRFAFCGYPVAGWNKNADPAKPKHWSPCGAIATPGCAYCDAHASAVVDDMPRRASIFEKVDSLALDTGNGKTPPLTADDIVERAERRAIRRQNNIWLSAMVAVTLFVVLTETTRPWTHLQFFFGTFVGAVAEAIVWGVWRWRKGDRP